MPIVTSEAATAEGEIVHTMPDIEAKAKKPKEPKTEPKGETPVEEEGKAESTGAAARVNVHSAVMDRLKKSQDMEVRDWLDQISGEAPMRAALHRKDPKNFLDPLTQQFVKVDGVLTTYDRAVDPEEVQKTYGGGTYQLVVQTRGTDGKWKYFGAKTFEVAGDPNLNAIPRAMKPEPAPTSQIQQKDPTESMMLGKMTDFMIQQARGSNAPPAPPQVIHQGLSDAAVQAMIKPLELQIANLTKLLELKDAEMTRVRETAGKDPFRDKMLDTLMDGDSARVKALRENYDSEIRQLKEGFRQDLERERDRHQRDIERMEKTHERELSTMKASHEQAIALATQKGDITKMVLERETATLEKQLEANRTELTALRARKDQSIKEKVEELNAIKELVGDGDEEEQSTLEKIIGAVGNLPAVVNMAERAANGGRPVQQQAQAAQPEQPKIVRNKETGEVHLRKADGSLIPVKKKPVPVTTADGQQFELPPVDPEQVKQAIQFMEGAFRSDTDPKTFAASARPFLSENMLGAMRALGISEFLSKVGKVSAASPLATMRGRQWTKKVAAALLGEEEVPPAAAPASDDAQPPVET